MKHERAERAKRAKRIEWNKNSSVVDVAIMSVAISRDSSRVCSSSSKLARFARSPHVNARLGNVQMLLGKLLEYLNDGAGNHPSLIGEVGVVGTPVRRLLNKVGVAGAKHRMGFSRSCLPISKNCCVEAVTKGGGCGLNVTVDLILRVGRGENSIVSTLQRFVRVSDGNRLVVGVRVNN